MFLAAIILILVFMAVAKGYKRNEGKAPNGLQSFMEPFFLFIRDEVCIPMMGNKYERFQPFIMTILETRVSRAFARPRCILGNPRCSA